MLQSKELSVVFLHHPELLFFNFNFIVDQYIQSYSYITVNIFDVTQYSSEVTALFFFAQFLVVFYFALLFIIAYFSFFTSAVKEESTIDSDYLMANLLVESEKEIGSLDDMILGLLILVYIFG